MRARGIMFQGTGSDVGKSLIVAGLCRIFARRGLRVAPFKAQNMSNNAAATASGGEIARAQWLQAMAAGAQPSVHMNPVLLKPQSNRVSQVVVRGKVMATLDAKDYQAMRGSLLDTVLESYHTLAKDADLVLVEGAGSPAEINLRAHDIANMGFARAAGCPVALIGDIERGGVIASLAGTHAVLAPADRAMIKGFLINKFRGDPALFQSGRAEIVNRTGWKDLGLIAHHATLAQLPQEDSLNINAHGSKALRQGSERLVVALRYPSVANFDDLDALAQEPGVTLRWLKAGEALPGETALAILPGSKSTIADLAFLRAQGWDIDLHAHVRRGGRVLGLCGGYQMLGRLLSDPEGVEGPPRQTQGLGLLDIDTYFSREKIVAPWNGACADTGCAAEGYRIHLGVSSGEALMRPMFASSHGPEGARSQDDRVRGTYIHGVLAGDAYRAQLLHWLGAAPSNLRYGTQMEGVLNGWADALEAEAAVDVIEKMALPIRCL